MATALQSQVSIAGGLYEFADVYDARAVTFRDRLASGIRLSRQLPDLLQGIQSRNEVTVRLKNVGTWRATPEGTVPVGDENTTYDVTASDIMAGSEGILGKPASAQLYDLDTNATIFRLDGVIVDAQEASSGQFGMEEGEITINALDLAALQQTVPKLALIEKFPTADVSSLTSTDVPVFVAFGPMLRVPLSYLGFFAGRYQFGAFRSPAAGALTWTAVYRNKSVVAATEYTATQVNGCHIVGFEHDQVDGSGQRFTIQADVTSTEFLRPSQVGEFLLSNPQYGLGLTTNAASFVTAAAAYATALYTVAGGLTTRIQAQTVLAQLALRGAVIDRDTTGKYTWTVDTAALHTPAPVTLGKGDGHYENIIRVLGKRRKRAEERVKSLSLQGLLDGGFEGAGAYLLTATRTRQVYLGAELPAEQNPYIGDAVTLDRECDYHFKTLVSGEQTLDLLVETGDTEIPCGRLLTLRQIVPVDIPNLRIDATTVPWTIEGLAVDRDGFEVSLRSYAAASYTYQAMAVRTAPGASLTTDYSFTLPDTPGGFGVVSSVFVADASGRKIAATTIEADAPPVNVTSLVFQAFQTSVIPFLQLEVKVTPGQQNVRVQMRFPSGSGPDNTYDLQCWARNVANTPPFRDGLVAQILNYVPGTDTVAPAVPTGMIGSVGTGKAVTLKWNKNSDPVAEYGIYRHTADVPASAVKIAETDSTVFVDTTVTIGQPYFYWLSAFDFYENESAKNTTEVNGPFTPTSATDTTPPSDPAAMTFVSATTYQSSEVGTRAAMLFTIPAMPAGGAIMNALYRRTGQATWTIATQLTAGGIQQRFDDLTPGNNYDFALQAFSAASVGSAVVQATGNPRLAPGDLGAPAVVTWPVTPLFDHPPRGILARWNSNTESDLASYEVQSDTTSGFNTGNLITRNVIARPGAGPTQEAVLTGLTNGTTYFVRVRAKDFSGNPTAAGVGWSATVSRTVPRVGTDDHDDRAVTAVKIALATITNAEIGSLNADKIKAGMLIVTTAAGAGATAIFVDNAGTIRMKSMSGSPSRIVFEDTSAGEKAVISGKSFELDINPSADNNGIGLLLGEVTLRWDKILLTAVNRISVKGDNFHVDAKFATAQNTGSQITGLVHRDQFPIYNSAGTLLGYVPIINV